MNKIKLSVVLSTLNEAENIARCLDSIRDIADEIVIVDEGSTDDTKVIAKKYGSRIIDVVHNDNFHITKNIAIGSAKGEWILQLDADEKVSKGLYEEIKGILKKGSKYNGLWMNRSNWFLNRFLKKGGQYPDPTMRFYRNGKGRLPAQDVHEQAQVDGEVGYFKNDLLHYRDTSFEKYLAGFNRYTSFIASQLREKKEKLNIINAFNYLVVKPIYTFLLVYLRHRGYVDGFPGFVFALFSGLRFAIAYIKYWQVTKYPAHD
ncbi:MAG: glycosyltransferase family 2 protein [Candidatus Amesbacteria bacterium]|nr:glycosyltransferase family 2 protein [Candidatus Amesbacteria bacterium]